MPFISLYNEFKSVMQQRVVVERLLPIPREVVETAMADATVAPQPVEYLYEPAPEELFRYLLPSYAEVLVFRALLESNAAFYAAQMTAMDAATRNSGEMIDSLTLYMNKVRQAAITREIIEVVSGAQAQRRTVARNRFKVHRFRVQGLVRRSRFGSGFLRRDG